MNRRWMNSGSNVEQVEGGLLGVASNWRDAEAIVFAANGLVIEIEDRTDERDAALARAETAERQVEQLRAALINLKRQSIRTAAHTDECMGVVNESPCICGLEAAYVETEAALAATAPTVKEPAESAPAAGGGECI